MASLTPISQSHALLKKPNLTLTPPPPNFSSSFIAKDYPYFKTQSFKLPPRMATRNGVVSATTAEKRRKRYPGEAKGFVEEMRFVAMKLHTREQAKEGEKEVKEPEERPVVKWEPSVDGYLKFLVDSKLVYDTLEGIIEKAAFPFCSMFSFFHFSHDHADQLSMINFLMLNSETLDWKGLKNCQRIYSGSRSKAMPFQNHLRLVLPMLSILKNYQRRILRHSYATSTIYILPTLLVVA
ncbi:Plant heme oxygenase family protein isoform 2 [Theobroma cacao]|uniref:heme oxygenase (biliverdin-producing) n=1 Tax=Theobroma cacao TaxID=3641 RepID=A0A061GMF9_THECC|nr:Plant heme oxygenase family protein isoform 2 [Theobroma cacao]